LGEDWTAATGRILDWQFGCTTTCRKRHIPHSQLNSIKFSQYIHKFKKREINFEIQSMTMASFVRETRGRKTKLDAGLQQQLNRVVTIANKTTVDKTFRLLDILLNLYPETFNHLYANKNHLSLKQTCCMLVLTFNWWKI
jgi:aminopeptidase C